MLYVRRIGDGAKPVIFLHGFLGSGRNLRTLASRWSEVSAQYTFLLMDLPGHGQSASVQGGATLSTISREVLETARAEGFVGPYALVGHSFGGRVSLAAFGEAPELVEKVVMLDIAPGPIPAQKSGSRVVLEILKRAPTEVPQRKEMLDYLVHQGLSVPVSQWLMMNLAEQEGVYRWQIDAQALSRLHDSLNSVSLWPLVEGRRLELSLLCVRGDRSHYVTTEDVARLRKAGASVETLQSGHDVHVDALEELLSLLKERVV